MLAERKYNVKADTAEEAHKLRKAEERRQMTKQKSDHKMTERMLANSKKDSKYLEQARDKHAQGRRGGAAKNAIR